MCEGLRIFCLIGYGRSRISNSIFDDSKSGSTSMPWRWKSSTFGKRSAEIRLQLDEGIFWRNIQGQGTKPLFKEAFLIELLDSSPLQFQATVTCSLPRRLWVVEKSVLVKAWQRLNLDTTYLSMLRDTRDEDSSIGSEEKMRENLTTLITEWKILRWIF